MGLADFDFPFAVASPSGLSDGVKSCHGAIYDWEIDIDTSLDQLGGNEADGKFFIQSVADISEHLQTMLRAHEGGEVEVFFGIFGQELEETVCVLACVNDTEGLGGLCYFAGDGFIWELAAVGDVDSVKVGEELLWVLDDFSGAGESDGKV